MIFDCAAPAHLRLWRTLLNWILFLFFHKYKKPTNQPASPLFPWKIYPHSSKRVSFWSHVPAVLLGSSSRDNLAEQVGIWSDSDPATHWLFGQCKVQGIYGSA